MSEHAASLFLLIDDKYYRVERLYSPESNEPRGWRLSVMSEDKGEDFGPYAIVRTPSGRLTCECPDWLVRHQKAGTPCKHQQALIAVSLLKGKQ